MRWVVALVTVCLVSLAIEARAAVTFNLVWTATTGSGVVGSSTITAVPGDVLTLSIRMVTTQQISLHSVDLRFDTDLKNELNLQSVTQWSGVGGYVPLVDVGPTVESTASVAGSVLDYNSAKPSAPFLAAGTYTIGTATFVANAPVTDGADVFIGFFNPGISGVVDTAGNLLNPTFGSATVNTPTVTINPGGIGGVYTVGQPITISVNGNPQGAVDNAIFGRLAFSNPALGNIASAVPVQTTLTPTTVWTAGVTSCTASNCTMFNQIGGLTPSTPTNQLNSSVSFVATTPGTSSLTWVTSPPGFAFDFFGLTNAPGSSITVLPPPTLAVDLGGHSGVYHVGERITITVHGNPNGAFDTDGLVYGSLVFSNPAIAAPNIASAVPVQSTLSSPVSGPWAPGLPTCNSSGCVLFDQSGFADLGQVTSPLVASVSFVATNIGTTSVLWDPGSDPASPHFFNLSPAPPVIGTITVAPGTPVPLPRGAAIAIAALLLAAETAMLWRRQARRAK
jgi:hypothetical protein